MLSLAGAGCGWGWRVMTAAVSGGNIGGAMVLYLGVPIGLVLVWVALRSRRQALDTLWHLGQVRRG
jgi:hypothetical protein